MREIQLPVKRTTLA